MLMRVVMRVADIDRDRAEFPVPHTLLGDDSLGKPHDGGGRAAQYDTLDAVVVVQMSMQGGNGDIVLPVLHARQSPRQIPLVVVVDIAQDADAERGSSALQALAVELIPQQIPERLRAILVAFLGHQPIEGIRELIIHGNRQSPHGCDLSACCPSRPPGPAAGPLWRAVGITYSKILIRLL